MQAASSRELGVEGDRRARCPGARRPGGRRRAASTSTPGPCSSIHGARMNTARTGPPSRPAISRSASKERIWRPNALRRRDDVHQAEVVAVEHDQARRRCRDRRAGARERAQRLGQALALDAERHRRRLAAGDARARRGLGPRLRAASRTSRGSAPSARSTRACASKPPCRARTPTSGAQRRSPAAAGEELPSSSLRASSDCIAAPEALARRARRARGRRSAWSPRRSRAARAGGSADLKMPEPTKTPSAPSCITSDGVGRRGDAAGAEQRRPAACPSLRDARARGRAARRAPWRRSRARPRRACRGAASRR